MNTGSSSGLDLDESRDTIIPKNASIHGFNRILSNGGISSESEAVDFDANVETTSQNEDDMHDSETQNGNSSSAQDEQEGGCDGHDYRVPFPKPIIGESETDTLYGSPSVQEENERTDELHDGVVLPTVAPDESEKHTVPSQTESGLCVFGDISTL